MRTGAGSGGGGGRGGGGGGRPLASRGILAAGSGGDCGDTTLRGGGGGRPLASRVEMTLRGGGGGRPLASRFILAGDGRDGPSTGSAFSAPSCNRASRWFVVDDGDGDVGGCDVGGGKTLGDGKDSC